MGAQSAAEWTQTREYGRLRKWGRDRYVLICRSFSLLKGGESRVKTVKESVVVTEDEV